MGDELLKSDYGPRFHNEAYTAEGTRIVRITDLDWFGRLDYSSMPRHTLSSEVVEKSALSPGDIIFARSGATVGKVALIEPGDPTAIPGAYFIRLRFTRHVEPAYALCLLACGRIQKTIEVKSRQSAQQNFSGPSIKRLPLPLPPLSLQKAFAQLRSKLVDSGARQSECVEESDSLFLSLAHRLFHGELKGAKR